jgi:hypothetical protein
LWVRLGAYNRVEHLKGALRANTRRDWKGLIGTITLAY